MKNRKNKAMALILISLGTLVLLVMKDATLLVVALPISVVLFVSKRNWID